MSWIVRGTLVQWEPWKVRDGFRGGRGNVEGGEMDGRRVSVA